MNIIFQSTLPAWGETAFRHCHDPGGHISIHSPRMGRDGAKLFVKVTTLAFQSTLPAWGETRLRPHQRLRQYHFNPLSPHGERRGKAEKFFRGPSFQSTLPAWGETRYTLPASVALSFQSTLPAWGETMRKLLTLDGTESISIHSPRMGRDTPKQASKAAMLAFQSTLPAWGETPV